MFRDGRRTADGAILYHGKLLPIPPMSCPRRSACSVVIDNEMWVMGGTDDDGNDLAMVEVYSPKANSWRSCTPMNQRRWGAVAGVVGGRVVVAGGFCDGEFLSSAEAYTGTGWTPLPPMPHEATWATACVLNGRLHVMGGHESNTHQVLQTTEENGLAWTVKADLPANRHGAASVVFQGNIWVMGGNVDEEPSASVLTYNAEADAWETGPPLPSPQEFCTTAMAFGNGILVFGLGKTTGYDNSGWAEVDTGFARLYGRVFLG